MGADKGGTENSDIPKAFAEILVIVTRRGSLTVSWWPFPSPGDLSDPGIEPASPAFAGGFYTTEQSEKLINPGAFYLKKGSGLRNSGFI